MFTAKQRASNQYDVLLFFFLAASHAKSSLGSQRSGLSPYSCCFSRHPTSRVSQILDLRCWISTPALQCYSRTWFQRPGAWNIPVCSRNLWTYALAELCNRWYRVLLPHIDITVKSVGALILYVDTDFFTRVHSARHRESPYFVGCR